MLDSIILKYIVADENLLDKVEQLREDAPEEEPESSLESYVSSSKIDMRQSLDNEIGITIDDCSNTSPEIIIEGEFDVDREFHYQSSMDDESYVTYSNEEFEMDNSSEDEMDNGMIMRPDYISTLYDGLDGEESVFIFWQACIARLPKHLWYMTY